MHKNVVLIFLLYNGMNKTQGFSLKKKKQTKITRIQKISFVLFFFFFLNIKRDSNIELQQQYRVKKNLKNNID